jgi:hypothetical protein
MQTTSLKQQIAEANARHMAEIIRRARARFAAMPTTQKAQMARFLEDQLFASLNVA